jgi:hypothetical protein
MMIFGMPILSVFFTLFILYVKQFLAIFRIQSHEKC